MERQPPEGPENYGELPPAPLGAVYEQEPDVLSKLQALRESNPNFLAWVTSRADEIILKIYTAEYKTKGALKIDLLESFIEAYDSYQAKIERDKIKTLYEELD